MPDTVSGGGDRAVKQPCEVPAHGAHFPKEGQTFNKHTEEKSKKKKCCGANEHGHGMAMGTKRRGPSLSALCVWAETGISTRGYKL